MKIEPKDVILWSVFDDEPNLVVNKASFGGDRSAAGRYAAEQRWKGHVKRQTRTDANRSTAQQLSEGPKNLAFGRDKNGLPIVGTRKELEARYGKTDKERAAYFIDKYGVKVNFVDLEGLDEDKYPDAIEVKLGAVQALDDMLSNLNVIPVGLTSKPPLAEIRIGTDNPMRNSLVSQSATAFVQHSNKDSRAFLLGLDTGDISNLAQHLLFSTTPITEQQALMGEDESPLDVINLRRLEEQSSQTIAGRFGISDASRDKGATWEKTTREDETTVARRLGYAIMIHEFGHVLDTLSFFDSKKRNNVKDMTSDRLEEDDSPAWRETEAVSEYGRYNTWEKMAEGFTAWFLFSQSANPVRYYSDLTNVGFSEASRWLKNQEVIDIKGASVPIVRPLLDSLRPPQTAEQVLKRVGDFVTTVADLPFDHPVIMFALQPFMDDGLMKAKVRVDAMIAAALAKASFGGDRSAAGRYAAEQRWKGHTKKGDNPSGGRTTDQKLAEGPTSLLFGRDANGMPVMGSVTELRIRYGNSIGARERYFYDKYGLRLSLDEVEQESAQESAHLGALQALEELCLSLNVNGKVIRAKLGNIPRKNYSGVFELGNNTVKVSPSVCAEVAEQLVRTMARVQGFEWERGKPPSAFAASNDSHVTGMFSAVQAALTNLGPLFQEGQAANEKNARNMISETSQRMGYSVMVHEFGHVVDWKLTGGFTSKELESNPEWYNLVSPSAYGRSNYLEKAAESFSGWWLFSGEPKGKTAEYFRLVRDRSVKVLAPIFDAKQHVVKSEGLPFVFSELPAEHPVFLFVLVGLLKKTNQTARVRRDAMISAAFAKASFGGDRSAAGRYAAEQRWKGHTKKEPKGPSGRSLPTQVRTTEQKLVEGPQSFAFGVDEKGLPVVGTIEQLEARFGKDYLAQEKYFKDKYGLKVVLGVGSGAKKRDPIEEYQTVLRHARLSALQALDDICSNLTRVPEGLEVFVTDRIMPTGYSSGHINGFVERNAEDTRLARLGVNIKTIDDCVGYLSGKQFEYERAQDIEEKVNVRFMYEGEPSAVQAVTTNLKSASEKDRSTIVSRLAYGVMVHEFGHVLDLKGPWLPVNFAGQGVRDAHRSPSFDDEFREAPSVSGYGSISGKSRPQEKMAEGFAAWFLFSRSSNIVVPVYWDADGKANFTDAVGIKDATSRLMRPLLDDLKDVVKQLDISLDITKLLPTHPVLLFALQPFVNDGVAKARPENPWKRGYNTQYFRVRDAVLARKPLCYKCKKNQASEVDHVRPLINGGSNTVGNLRPICVSCNRKSGGGERRVKKSVRVDAMVELAFDKASFGGDRSAAGRYAAEQRWKGHVKAEPKGRDFREVMATFRTVAEVFQERVKQDAKGLSDKDLQREFDAIDPVTEPTLEEQTYAGWKKQALAELISERKIERARGGIVEHVRSFDGMSVKIESGEQPVDGFMVARREHSRIVTAEEFFDETKGKQILSEFLKENRRRFGKDQFLGIWHNEENGMVYLDITDNIRDRSEAERLGRERNQISIWDVVNMVEIKTGGTGEG